MRGPLFDGEVNLPLLLLDGAEHSRLLRVTVLVEVDPALRLVEHEVVGETPAHEVLPDRHDTHHALVEVVQVTHGCRCNAEVTRTTI